MKTKSQQRGITFIGLLIVGILVALAIVVAAQIVPTYVEYVAVKKAVNLAAREDTVPTIKRAFTNQATIDQITSIDEKDIEITKENDKVVVSFEYERDIHLVGPAYLVMRYEGRSE